MIQIYKPARSKEWTNRRKLEDILQVVVHHSASKFYPGRRAKTLAEIDKITAYHRQKDWGGGAKAPSMAYHFVVDPIGRIFQVNPPESVIWHAREANVTSLGVLVLGNYEDQKPSILVRRALIRLQKLVHIFYGIPADYWFSHDEVQKAKTLCCGRFLREIIKK